MNQSNYIFFRSEKEGQITYHDVELCKPLFWEFLQGINPTRIIAMSARLRQYFLSSGMVEEVKNKAIIFGAGTRNILFEVSKGRFKLGTKAIDICFLPHPMYRIPSKSRKECWDFCFSAS